MKLADILSLEEEHVNDKSKLKDAIYIAKNIADARNARENNLREK